MHCVYIWPLGHLVFCTVMAWLNADTGRLCIADMTKMTRFIPNTGLVDHGLFSAIVCSRSKPYKEYPLLGTYLKDTARRRYIRDWVVNLFSPGTLSW